MQKLNPKEWANIVELMKGTPIWEEVKRNYSELTNDNEIADEVLAFYSGSRGAERLREEHAKILKGNGGVFEKVKAINAIKRVMEALKRFLERCCRMVRYSLHECRGGSRQGTFGLA